MTAKQKYNLRKLILSGDPGNEEIARNICKGLGLSANDTDYFVRTTKWAEWNRTTPMWARQNKSLIDCTGNELMRMRHEIALGYFRHISFDVSERIGAFQKASFSMAKECQKLIKQLTDHSDLFRKM